MRCNDRLIIIVQADGVIDGGSVVVDNIAIVRLKHISANSTDGEVGVIVGVENRLEINIDAVFILRSSCISCSLLFRQNTNKRPFAHP